MVNTLFASSTSISPEDFRLALECYVKDPLSGKVATTIEELFSTTTDGQKLSDMIMAMVNPSTLDPFEGLTVSMLY